MQNNYDNITYSDEDQQILDNTKLATEDLQKIKNMKTKLINKNYAPAIETIYKFYKNNYSTSDLAEIYSISTRQVQRIFKELGINRDKIEAQQIAINKIDREDMKKIYKKTLLERLTDTELSGSTLEQHMRYQVDFLLKDALPNCEIIVGINSMSTSNADINIPIIIIKDKSLYKYIIEIINSTSNASTNIKSHKVSAAFYKGYTLYQISTKSYYNSKDNCRVKYENEIKNKLIQIINNIVWEVSENSSLVKLE